MCCELCADNDRRYHKRCLIKFRWFSCAAIDYADNASNKTKIEKQFRAKKQCYKKKEKKTLWFQVIIVKWLMIVAVTIVCGVERQIGDIRKINFQQNEHSGSHQPTMMKSICAWERFEETFFACHLNSVYTQNQSTD